MVRPRLKEEIIQEIKYLRADGKSIDAILNQLGEERVSRGSVAKYVKEYDNLPLAIKERDRRVKWHRLEEYGLQGEESAYVLRLWANIGAGPLPTVRDVKWWCKVRQLAPDAPPRKVYQLAQQFIWRERLTDWGYEAPDDAGVWAEIAFHSWVNLEAAAKYKIAFEDGRVPESKGAWFEIPPAEGMSEEDIIWLLKSHLEALRTDWRPYDWDALVEKRLKSTEEALKRQIEALNE
jgi:hypothetical protein